MIAHCEANQAWLENITYQMTLMPYKQQSTHLAGPIGLLKVSLKYLENNSEFSFSIDVRYEVCT